MTTEFSFKFPLPDGLHARPASAFEDVARPFASEITFINDRTGAQACVKSVLGMVSTSTLPGDPCRIVFQGADETGARDEQRRSDTEKLPHSGIASADSRPGAGESHRPPCLR